MGLGLCFPILEKKFVSLFGPGALSAKILLVRIVENKKIIGYA